MITGIIAEYNIFHNGHKYQIDEVKKQSDYVVSVMSGSFVQRGDVAITDNWSRAKSALLCGADLVLELPVCFSLNAAQNFASGGINTLNALGIIDSVAFGSECGDINSLTETARIMENENSVVSENIQSLISSGINYPSALSKAYENKIAHDILTLPNNILAIEYIRALIRTNSSIRPVTIQRANAKHNDNEIHNNFTSASKIREMIMNGENIDALIPYNLSDIGGFFPYCVSRLDSAVISKLRLSGAEQISSINEVTEGLENRIIQSAMETDSFSSLCKSVKSKRYTMSKIRRSILASLLDFTKDIYKPMPEYIRVLGMNKNGMEILKKAKKHCSLPIITKAADFKEKSRQFELDIRATDTAALCSPDKAKRCGGTDFKNSPIILN